MWRRCPAGRGTAADVQRKGGVPGNHRFGMRDALAQRQVLRTGQARSAPLVLCMRALLRKSGCQLSVSGKDACGAPASRRQRVRPCGAYVRGIQHGLTGLHECSPAEGRGSPAENDGQSARVQTLRNGSYLPIQEGSE